LVRNFWDHRSSPRLRLLHLNHHQVNTTTKSMQLEVHVYCYSPQPKAVLHFIDWTDYTSLFKYESLAKLNSWIWTCGFETTVASLWHQEKKLKNNFKNTRAVYKICEVCLHSNTVYQKLSMCTISTCKLLVCLLLAEDKEKKIINDDPPTHISTFSPS
jgi:hypothetical protein